MPSALVCDPSDCRKYLNVNGIGFDFIGIFLGSLGDDLDGVFRCGALKLQGLIHRRIQPCLAVVFGQQQHRHGLGMDRRDALLGSVVRNE